MSTRLMKSDELTMLSTSMIASGTRAYHQPLSTMPWNVAPGATMTPARSPATESGRSGSTAEAGASFGDGVLQVFRW